MANEEQLYWLRQGVEHWNDWRREHPDVKPDLNGAKFSSADLEGADLEHATLSFANLSFANLQFADLSGAILIIVQALGTDFTGATLTGACIEDWNINAETKLEGVVCDYIYLKGDQQERRPSDPNQSFAPGEFTKLFQKFQETVDLIFHHGVDWQVLLLSLEKLKVEAEGAELSIQAIGE